MIIEIKDPLESVLKLSHNAQMGSLSDMIEALIVEGLSVSCLKGQVQIPPTERVRFMTLVSEGITKRSTKVIEKDELS